MYKIDPGESKEYVQLTGPLLDSVNFAIGASWTQTAHEYAITMNKLEEDYQ